MSPQMRRKKLSQEVSEEILALIDNGEVVIGGQLPTETELIELFNVSRTSVREAVKSLAAFGIVEVRPGVGTFVVGARPGPLRSLPGRAYPISLSDLLEILEFRQIFEPEAAALAAQRATPEDISELHHCVEVLERGVAAGIRPPEDLGFHLALARATKNTALVDISSLTIRFYEQDVYLPNDLDVEGHREIYEAVKKSDPDAAREAMRAHLGEIERRYHALDDSDGVEPDRHEAIG
jgi:GntR family transcriptional regulator, transcriptional repressor for pyruvate dehydrogenase complex